jgi:2'-5' RNA ligase
MFLSLAFVPPPEVLDHLASHLDPAGLEAAGLEVVPVAEQHMSMTAFGNVSKGDVPKLVQAVTRASESWPSAPKVRLAGGAALEWPGDTAVWATSDGEVESMEEVARTIAPAVLRLGFAVDRRRFHPWVPLARITDATELASLEQLVATLETYSGPEWVMSRLSLLRGASSGRGSSRAFETVHEFPLHRHRGSPDSDEEESTG